MPVKQNSLTEQPPATGERLSPAAWSKKCF